MYYSSTFLQYFQPFQSTVYCRDKGSLIYTGCPTKINPYFESIDKKLPDLSNPADAFMRILEENNQGKEPQYFIEKYKENMTSIIDEEINGIISNNKENNIASKNLNSASFCEASLILSKRAFLNVIRNPTLLKMRLGSTLLFSFMISSVFWQLAPDTYEGVYARIGFIFFASINIFMIQIFGTILSFPIERAVFIRENSSSMYSPGSYFLAKNIMETPMVILSSSILLTICYFTVGMRLDGAQYFFLYLAGFVLEALTSQSLGYMLGTLFTNVSAAMGSVNIIVMPFILFAGTLINEESMPVWLFWLKYLSPLKYMNEIGNLNELENNNEITYGNGANAIVATLGYDVGFVNCYIILACMAIVYRVIAFIFLKVMVRKVG